MAKRELSPEHLEKLAAGREARKAAIASGECETTLKRTPIQRSEDNPTSLRFAIDAACYDCCYDPADVGTWKAQVTACQIFKCPLHKVRPCSNKED